MIAGIGNPGKEYKNTKHNIGFRVIDGLAFMLGVTSWQISHHSLNACVRIGRDVAMLVKPLTYVNCTGACVASIFQHYQMLPCDLLVVVDDVSLSLGQIRIKKKGSSGGHNGLQSIIEKLESSSFHRMRIGIGGRVQEENSRARNLADYVLSEFTDEEEHLLQKKLPIALDACVSWAKEGIESAMNAYNNPKMWEDPPESD